MEERPWTKSEFFAWNDGRRIVDLYELSKQLQCKQCSSPLDLRRTEKEMRYGLASVLYVQCNCGVLNDVHTGRTQLNSGDKNSPNTMYEINIKASINLLMYGAGASRILSFLALLDIPVPPPDDTSLIVPVTEDARMQPVPSTSPTTSTASTKPGKPKQAELESTNTSSFQQTPSSSSFAPDSSLNSEPEANAVPIPLNDNHEKSSIAASSVDQQEVNDNQNDSIKEIERLVNQNHDDDDEETDDGDNGDDDEYVPPSVVKTRTAPSPKKNILRVRGPKSARAKQAAKRVTQKRTAKAKIQKEVIEPPKEVVEVKEEKEENKKKETIEDKLDDPMDWSSTESEPEPTETKDSDASWQEEEDEEEEERPKRKRGRPRGSTDKVKRTRRSGYRTKKEQAPKKAWVVNETQELPKCTTCSKEFNSIKGYNLHMKRVHNQEVKERIELDSLILFVCAFCHMPYAREHRVVSHLEMKHWSPTEKNTEMFYKIPVTNFIKEDQTQVCYKTARYTCLHCGIDSMTRKTTGDHICISPQGFATCVARCPEGKKLTQQDGSNLFHLSERCSLCYMCGSQFSDTVGLEHHLLSVHGQASKRLLEHKCDECGAMFPVQSRLDRHKAAKHTVGPRPKSYMCDYCGKAYPSKSTMFRHRQLKHISGEKFQCEYCPKKFFKRHQWIIHTKRHLGEAPHQCQVCGKDFSCKYNLKTHERIHTGEKPYQCQLCDAAFAQKTSLDVHMKKHR